MSFVRCLMSEIRCWVKVCCPIWVVRCPMSDVWCPKSVEWRSVEWRSDVRDPMSNFQWLMSDVWCLMSDVRSPLSEGPLCDGHCLMLNIRCRMSDVFCLTSDGRCLMSNVRSAKSDVRCLLSDVRCLMSDVQCPMRDVRNPISDVRCPICDVQCPFAECLIWCPMYDVRLGVMFLLLFFLVQHKNYQHLCQTELSMLVRKNREKSEHLPLSCSFTCTYQWHKVTETGNVTWVWRHYNVAHGRGNFLQLVYVHIVSRNDTLGWTQS